MSQEFKFDPSICKLRHIRGSEAGTCPCHKPSDCPRREPCEQCGNLMDDDPFKIRDSDDHNEVLHVCYSCYMKSKE